MATNTKELRFAEIRQREEFVEALKNQDGEEVLRLCRKLGAHWVITQTLVNFNSGYASDVMCRIIMQYGIDEAVEAFGPDKLGQMRVTDQVLSFTLSAINDANECEVLATKFQHPQSVLKIMNADNYNEIARSIVSFYTNFYRGYIEGYIAGIELTDLPVVAGVLVQIASKRKVELSSQALLVIPKSAQRQVVTQAAIRAILRRISKGSHQREQIVAMFGLLLSITEPHGD